MLSPGTYFGQYHHFLMSAAAKDPCSLTPQWLSTHKSQNPIQTLYLLTKLALSIIEAKASDLSKIIKFFWTEICWLVFPFVKIEQPDDVTLSTPCIMIFISKGLRFPWNEHESRTTVFIHPFGHGLINAIDPAG